MGLGVHNPATAHQGHVTGTRGTALETAQLDGPEKIVKVSCRGGLRFQSCPNEIYCRYFFENR